MYDLILDLVDELLTLESGPQAWRVSLCSLSLLLATAHKLSVNFLSALDNLFCSLLDPGWLTGLSTAPLPCTLVKTVVSVFWLCTFVARVVGHPQPSLSGTGVPWVSMPGPTGVP